MDTFFRFCQWLALVTVVAVIGNILRQVRPRSKSEPPAVFHWLPVVGNAVSYGTDPYKFFTENREKVTVNGCWGSASSVELS